MIQITKGHCFVQVGLTLFTPVLFRHNGTTDNHVVREATVTKGDLIEKVAKDAGIPKSAAENALNATLDSIKTALKKGQKVTLVGFGAFSVTKRKARKGRNPKTGQEIRIPAMKVPKFSAGEGLKKAVK